MAKNNKYSKQTALLNEHTVHTYLSQMSLILVTFFLVWAPLQKGLFNGYNMHFERPLYFALIIAAAVLLLTSIDMMLQRKLQAHLPILLLSLVIPLTYLLSLSQAQSPHLAFQMVWISMIYLSFFLAATQLAASKSGAYRLQMVVLISGSLPIGFGLLHWFGIVSLPNAITLTESGYRLNSVFQYANSYAAYLLAFSLAYGFVASHRRGWLASAAALMLVPTMLSFVLTLSRGSLVVLPVIVLVLLSFLPVIKQIVMLLQLLIAGGLALLLSGPMMHIGTAVQQGDNTIKGWAMLLGASLLNACLSYILRRFGETWLERKLQRFQKLRLAAITIPALLLVLAACLVMLMANIIWVSQWLPTALAERIASINFTQHSVLERLTFYQDAFAIFRDYPLLGAGGGAWPTLYPQYQSYPYISQQTHNFLMQTLIEVGVVGFVALLILLASIGIGYVRRYLRATPGEERERHFVFFIIGFSILLHSVIDFNMSFIYLACLVFLCLGALSSISSTTTDKSKTNSPDVRSTKRTRLRYIPGMRSGLALKTKITTVRRALPVSLCLLAVFMFVIGGQMLLGHSGFMYAIFMNQQQRPVSSVFTQLDVALAHSYNPTYALYKIELLDNAYATSKTDDTFLQLNDELDLLLDKEPRNRQAIAYKYAQLQGALQWEEAHEWAKHQRAWFPWDITTYEMQLETIYEEGKLAFSNGNMLKLSSLRQEAGELMQEVKLRTDRVSTIPPEHLPGKPFEVTPVLSDWIDKLHHLDK